MARVGSLTALLLALAAAIGVRAAGQDSPGSAPASKENSAWAIQITSPLGRTGVVTRVRIVAQIVGLAHADQPVRARFYVDGQLLGEVSAPPYSVEWLDDNPFLQREIVVQAQGFTDSTSDAKTIGDAIAAMKAQGGTAILDGLMESMKLFENAEGRGRRRRPGHRRDIEYWSCRPLCLSPAPGHAGRFCRLLQQRNCYIHPA